jgi:hypothetical protein
MHRRSLAAGLVVIAGVGLGSSAAAQAPTGTSLTLRELDKGSTFKLVDNPPRSTSRREPTVSLGDQAVFTNPLVDPAGAKLGTLYGSCSVVKGGRITKALLLCHGIYKLSTGELSVEALTTPGVATTTGSVTGGTGAFANARGVFTSTLGANDNSDTSFALAG